MVFLPIVDRELHVAARKRSTYWLRVVSALVALVIGGGFLGLTIAGFGIGTPNLGRVLFAVLTWLSVVAALSAGLFFTSDCLSEEKREGTLGLLFLTELRGADVVFGKLVANSLRSFYGLLSVFPILAITLLMGGLTGAQFWRTTLALVSVLLTSLAAGLFVSAISRDSQKALGATLILLGLLVAGGPACDAMLAAAKHIGYKPVFSLTSPGYLFVTAGAWGTTYFWWGLVANQAVAWTLVILTCVLLPLTWQIRGGSSRASRMRFWKSGGVNRRRVLRRNLLERNPVLWLACRGCWQAVACWALAILSVGVFVVIFADDSSLGLWEWSLFGSALTLMMYLGIASQAARFFVDAQRSGLVELFLATPLTVIEITQGQWRALLRMFCLPLALCLATQSLGALLVQQKTWNMIGAATATLPSGPLTTTNTAVATNYSIVVTKTTGSPTATVSVSSFTSPDARVMLALSVAGMLTVFANLSALAWFGMWTGLNSKSTNLAALKAIVFVQIIPWFVVSLVSAIIVPLLLLPSMIKGTVIAPNQIMVWYPILTTGIATVLSLTKDVAFLLWSRRKLYLEFRQRAARAVAPIRLMVPPVIARS